MTIRQIAALYIYENQLYADGGNGKMVREALENAARYYNILRGRLLEGPLIIPRVIGDNYDMAQGVDYEIDLTQPAGIAFAICAGLASRLDDINRSASR